jgi:hypothetical protein
MLLLRQTTRRATALRIAETRWASQVRAASRLLVSPNAMD